MEERERRGKEAEERERRGEKWRRGGGEGRSGGEGRNGGVVWEEWGNSRDNILPQILPQILCWLLHEASSHGLGSH